MPLKSQGIKIVPTSTFQLQVTFCVDKGLVTPPPPGTKIVQVQIEHEEELQQVSTDEVSEEGQIGEKPQQTSQDIEMINVGSIDTWTINKEPSQREKTLERSGKGKGIAKKTSSSSKEKSPTQHIQRWLRKEVIRRKKQQFTIEEEDKIELIEVLRKLDSPPKDAQPLAFIMSDQNQDLFSHVALPPPQ